MESMPKENAPSDVWIALLGRRDTPADGIADYCANLGHALAKRGIELRLARVDWVQRAWLGALQDLFRESKDWRGKWILLQYTALGWSRRGIPVGALVPLVILRLRGARCAIVFHEPWGTAGPRLIDRIRHTIQNWTVRTLYRSSQKSIFTEPLNTIPWLSSVAERSAFIPVGSNIPENLINRSTTRDRNCALKTIAVFCLSDPPNQQQEVSDISYAVRGAAAEGIQLRVVFVGRGTSKAQDEIHRAFQGTQIEICNRGLCEAAEVTRIFSESDAMLAVRGRLYLRRASVLAGLACGLPIIGYDGAAHGTAIEEAGIVLVPFRDQEALAAALRRVLTDADQWQELHEKNLRIQQEYFSWNVIAAEFVKLLEARRI
jgi:glycosyltransferase involved in cell wall biosynthesis